jgi:tetratricopeptide (TPR) repeat protein
MKDKAENIITVELAKQNVTETVIAKLKTDYLPLKINGIEDKEGYKKAHDARIVCRDHRILAEKICKAGREDAVKEQKAWLAKEKEVVAKISEVEQHLKNQEDSIDAEKEVIKLRAERLLKLPGRKELLKGLEEFYESDALDDEHIMSFNDAEWDKVVLLLKEKRFNKQQKEIDEANENKFVNRVNQLFAVGAEMKTGFPNSKVYVKHGFSVSEEAIKTYPDDKWDEIVQKFIKELPLTPISNISRSKIENFSIPEKIKKEGERLSEISDEEKLFNYASALENTSCPVMKTEEGKEVLNKAIKLVQEAINILRK